MAKRGSSPVVAVLTVLVVDDHRTFAEALGVVFGMERDFRVSVASNGLDAVAAAERLHPNVALMDLEMPGMGGVEAIRKMRSASSETRVLVLSGHDDDLLRAQAVEAGAVGFVSKFTPLQELPHVVRRVGHGETMIDRQEADRLARMLRHRRRQEATERQRANRLTPRQTQILQLMAEGIPDAEIARRLELSYHTLRTHVQNILTRLSVHTKVQALAVAIRQGKITAGG
jgi:two-component system, NarL family, response regulator LiaR